MWRYLVGAVGALLLAGAGVLMFRSDAAPRPMLALANPAAMGVDSGELPDEVPTATAKTREQKRFNRYDKDRDGKVTRDEYLLSRHKAYARLDTNHDGVLQFDEWSAKTEAKFATADADHSGILTPAEFATTAVKRKARIAKGCPPAKDDEEG
ncbi:MAG: histidine kinase [Sphingomonas sp.]|jgi:hypothetical protein